MVIFSGMQANDIENAEYSTVCPLNNMSTNNGQTSFRIVEVAQGDVETLCNAMDISLVNKEEACT